MEEKMLTIKDIIQKVPVDTHIRILTPENVNVEPPTASILYNGEAKNTPYTLIDEEAGDLFLTLEKEKPILNIVRVIYKIVDSEE